MTRVPTPGSRPGFSSTAGRSVAATVTLTDEAGGNDGPMERSLINPDNAEALLDAVLDVINGREYGTTLIALPQRPFTAGFVRPESSDQPGTSFEERPFVCDNGGTLLFSARRESSFPLADTSSGRHGAFPCLR